MSRLYVVAAARTQIAAQFGVDPVPELDWSDDIVEGSRGLVVRESRGRRVLQALRWGFARQTREMRARDEAPGIIGLVADLTNPMWEAMVVEPRYRCLIPLTHFANPDGPQGEKTRTWFSLVDQPLMAWAGFCQNTPDGPCYAGMTMTANEAIPPTNDRMPVLLEPGDYARWLEGSIQDVIRFQFREPVPAARMAIEPTVDLWRSGAPPPSGRAQRALI